MTIIAIVLFGFVFLMVQLSRFVCWLGHRKDQP